MVRLFFSRYFFYLLVFVVAIVGTSCKVSALTTDTYLKVEQISPSTLGKWYVLSSSGNVIDFTSTGMTLAGGLVPVLPRSTVTISVIPPPGMSARILLYSVTDQLEQTIESQQYSSALPVAGTYRVQVQYYTSKLGTIGVNSLPSKLRFTMIGPDKKPYTGMTPKTFQNIPAGSYTITVRGSKSCVESRPQTEKVEPEKRTTVLVTLTCNTRTRSKVDTSRPTKRSLIQAVEEREAKASGQRK